MPNPPIPTGANLPPPPLPGVGVPQPTAQERADQEARWAILRDKPLPKELAEVIVLWDNLLKAHPEIGRWARESISGTARL